MDFLSSVHWPSIGSAVELLPANGRLLGEELSSHTSLAFMAAMNRDDNYDPLSNPEERRVLHAALDSFR